MYKIVGFKATGKEKDGTPYDCSFMVSYPLVPSLPPADIQRNMQHAIQQFQQYHPTGRIEQQVEKAVMVRGR